MANWIAVVAMVSLSSVPSQCQGASKVLIYVGPQTRNGFIDIDAGIRDSIHDIQQECQTVGLPLTANPTEAKIQLLVLGRGMPVQRSVGSTSAVNGIGYGFVVPNQVPTITTMLKVGAYERAASREGGNWRNAAKNVVDDLKTWMEANRDGLSR